MERFARKAAEALNQVLETPIEAKDLETPPDSALGDFGFPCFRLAKSHRKAPPQVAAQIVADLKSKGAVPPDLEVVQAGPYVNFRVPPRVALDALLGDILRGPGIGEYGRLAKETRGTWVLEYSSPNIAKPFNIYHLRPTALGAALDRIGRYRGFRVISINHLGDWGTQYGKLAVAYGMFGKDLPSEPSIRDLVDIYVKFHQAAETDPTLEDKAREAFLKLEKGDPAITALWRKCVEIALKEFGKTYERLGVHFDHIWGESYYKDMLPPLLQSLEQQGLLVESEGARVVEVTDENGKPLPPCILQKKDGATIYATRDVAAALYRYDQFHFDRMTYIVGGEQKLHFQQVFGVLRRMGKEWAPRCEHVPFGLYRFKDAKMSTRKGNFVTLDDVLELAVERVKQIMGEREKATVAAEQAAASVAQLPQEEFDRIAEAIAIGAVVFHDLHTDPVKDVEFDLERVVDFEGETGPYLQYAHTRCLGILRKAQESGQGTGEYDPKLIEELRSPEELALVKTLGQLPLQLERTLASAKASALAHYLIDVTQAFGVFYRECRVLGEKPELTRARLMLVEATRRVLARGMALLGIPQPSRM
jgi:arginyl-tRNA synthetase